MHGELSTTSANEIIKLSKNDQEELLPHLLGRPLKDIKKIVKKAHVEGAKRAIEVSEEIPTIPKEFSELQNMAKKLNKALSKIILDSLEYSGDEYADIFKELNLLEVNLSQLLSHSNGATSYTIDTHSEETRSSIGKGENLEEIQLQH
jgi:ParB family chromosome partitioning protein